MKRITYLLAILAITFNCLAPLASAQSLPLPVQSEDVLRNHALAQVVRGTRSVWSESIDWSFPDTFTYTEARGDSAEDVLDKLFAVEFLYRMTNPQDSITGYVSLYDADGNRLFVGNAFYTGISAGAGEKARYTIWMQYIPLLDDVHSAEVIALKPDGTSGNVYSLDITEQGGLLFQPWHAGAPNGVLVVRFNDGSLVSYDLSKPNPQAIGSQKESSSYGIDGHLVIDSDGDYEDKGIELWRRPTRFLRQSAEGTFTPNIVGIYQENGQTSTERPIALVITDDATGVEKTVVIPEKGLTSFSVGAGKYRIHYIWNKFGQPGLLYTGPSSPGGGKG